MRYLPLTPDDLRAADAVCAMLGAAEASPFLAVERIEADAVLLRHSGRLLRLPVAEKSTRVRLPL